jgi:hypothetical protein
VFVLTGFAITQPLLDVTGRAPEFFVYWRASRADIVLFVLIVTLAPTLVLWLLQQFVGLAGGRARRAVHLLIIGLLLAAVAIQVAKKLIPDRGYSLLALGMAAGAAATVLIVRSSVARTFLSYLAPAPVIFALLFLVNSPVGALVSRPPSEAKAHALNGGGTRPPIVMIYFDEFPTMSLLNSKGVVDERVFPNFARLQQGSTWFRQATGVSGWTPIAIPPMLTGRYPQKRLAPSYVQFPDNLFTLLGDDYRIEASESITQLCPPSECGPSDLDRETGLLPVLRTSTQTAQLLVSPLKSTVEPGDQFAEQEEKGEQQTGEQQSHRAGDLWFRAAGGNVNQPTRFTDFLASLEATDEPTLRFLHILLPHAPFTHLPSGATYPDVPRSFHHTQPSTNGTPSGGELSYRQRHLLQLAYTDKLVGAVIKRLKDQGLYDESLIVLTADHGIWFEHGTKHPIDRSVDPTTQASAPEVAFVPTFVKLPGQTRGRIDDRNWVNIDLAPTIADALDIEIPWQVDGFSGLGPDRRKSDEKRWYDGRARAVTFSAGKASSRVLAGVVDHLARPDHGAAGLYEYGPHRDLVGKRISDLRTGTAASSSRADINLGATFKVEPKSGTVPAMIYGRTSGVTAGTPIAIAVNGTIGAVPIAFANINGNEVRLAGLVSDERFRDGSNTLQLFVVEGTGSQVVLRPLTHSRG